MGDDDKLDRTAARLMDDWRETNESWTQLIERIDAALRRAKAEVLELAARELCMYCNDPGNWAPMSNSGYHQCNTPGPNMTRCGATKIHALRRELDARAAQIEEGSK
jgi:hypothetical protein